MGGKKKDKKKSVVKDFNNAVNYINVGQNEKALPLLQSIIKKNPGNYDARHLLGIIALESGDFGSAEKQMEKAVALNPSSALFYNNLGTVYKAQGLFNKALQAYKTALGLKRNYPAAYNNLGTVLQALKKLSEAGEAYDNAIKLDPKFAEAHYNAGLVNCMSGKIREALQGYVKAIELKPDFMQAYSNLLYTLHFDDTLSPEEIFNNHLLWAQKFGSSDTSFHQLCENDFDPLKRLNIGFVSPDFCTHSVARFFESFLDHYDKNSLKVFLYSNTQKEDNVTFRFKKKADEWRALVSLTDEQASAMIRGDKIDILIDLAGHTRDNRLTLFVNKPAPLQMSWLGYPDTTGLATIDYRLTDEVSDPAGVTDQFYSEQLLRLPDIFLCFTPPETEVALSPIPYIKNGFITFGSFNNNAKISDKTIVAWAEILKRVENSVLKLKSAAFADEGVISLLQQKFCQCGIAEDRVAFFSYTVSEKEHLELYNTIDIALDTFPYNGTTTTCESLWMGVPVISLKGETHVARTGASILTATGLKDLITESIDDYVTLAKLLSEDIDTVSMLKTNLRSRMMASPLMDAKGFAMKMDSVFRIVWKMICQKRAETVPPACSNDNYFEKNSQVLKRYHPDLLPLASSDNDPEVKLEKLNSKDYNLLIKNSDGEFNVIYPDNIQDDTNRLIGKVKGLRGRILFVLGAGLCHFAEALLNEAGGANLIVLVEASSAIFNETLKVKDFSAIFSHPNVRLCIADKSEPFQFLGMEGDSAFFNDNHEFVEYEPLTVFFKPWYNRIKEEIEGFIMQKRIGKMTMARKGLLIFQNSLDNMIHMIRSESLDSLKNRFKDLPAVIVASGPSLNKNIEELKKAEGRAILFAVDSALAPLLRQKIVPDFVLSIDFNEFTYQKLAPFKKELRQTSFIFVPDVTPEIMNNLTFKKSYYTFTGKTSRQMFDRLVPTGVTSSTEFHSVVHLAIAAAQTAGCNPVVFTGLDLAFDEQKDHAKETILHWGNARGAVPTDVKMIGNTGRMLTTSAGFVAILRICEFLISQHADRLYIDASEGGLKKKGCRAEKLSDVIPVYMTKMIQKDGYEKHLPEKNWSGGAQETIETDFKSKATILDQLIAEADDLLSKTTRYLELDQQMEGHIISLAETGGLPGALPDSSKKIIGQMNRLLETLENSPVIAVLKPALSEHNDTYHEYELAYHEKKLAGDESGTFLTAYKQQVFLQTIRKNGLALYKDGLATFRKMVSLFSAAGETSEQQQETAKNRRRFLFEKNLYSFLEKEMEGVEEDGEICFFKGCIHLYNNRHREAAACLDKAMKSDPRFIKEKDLFEKKLEEKYVAILGTKVFPSYKKIIANKLLSLKPGHPDGLAYKKNFS